MWVAGDGICKEKDNKRNLKCFRISILPERSTGISAKVHPKKVSLRIQNPFGSEITTNLF